jgi:subtilisin family serine protease
MSSLASAKTLVVAVVDTGVDSGPHLENLHLCKSGHVSFVPGNNPLVDHHGHGTHIAGLISRNAGDANYCVMSIQYYDPDSSANNNMEATKKALRYAIDHKVDFINYSSGGSEPSEQEHALVKEALDKGITVVVAAGNDGKNLGSKCVFYPACYNDKRLVVVGNLRLKTKTELDLDIKFRSVTSISATTRADSSNYDGPVNRWEIGSHVFSDLPNYTAGYMTGTSQATAVATGKLVKSWKPGPVTKKTRVP